MTVVDQSAYRSVKTHNVPVHQRIYCATLDSELGDLVERTYAKADTSFNEGHQADNLINTDRTSWNVEREHQEELSPVLNAICDVYRTAIEQRMQTSLHMHADLKDSWIARSKAGAVVDPHHHGHNPSGWSFCFYAKIPSGKSSLTFIDHQLGSKTQVIVSEGEVLWFPSDCVHYTVDTEEGRMIYSGNFDIFITDQNPEEQAQQTQEQLDEQKVY